MERSATDHCLTRHNMGGRGVFLYLSCKIYLFIYLFVCELDVPSLASSDLVKILFITFRHKHLIQCMVSQSWSSYLIFNIKFLGVQRRLCLDLVLNVMWKRIKHISIWQKPKRVLNHKHRNKMIARIVVGTQILWIFTANHHHII